MKINIALLQLLPGDPDDPQANLAKGVEFCRRAAGMGADIALFPEMWNTGYAACEVNKRAEWEARAVAANSDYFQAFQGLAAELEMAIAFTCLEQREGGVCNTVALVDRHGQILFRYAKVHTCVFDWEAALLPGEEFYTAELDTAAGPVWVGAMICFDREFPESARILMLQGAELILIPNACEMEANRTAQLQTRAMENMVGMALANYAGPRFQGHSTAFDPIAFTTDERGRDMLVLRAGEEEGVYLASFDLDAMRAYRSREAWGNAYRRPHCYGALIDESVQEPFLRPDAPR